MSDLKVKKKKDLVYFHGATESVRIGKRIKKFTTVEAFLLNLTLSNKGASLDNINELYIYSTQNYDY